MTRNAIAHADCLDWLPTLEADSVDAVVCDPPYGLRFMGKDWDHGVPGEHFWREIMRVAKPGAHLLAFGGTRTFHRLAVAVEDAGWELRDTLMWLCGGGFPKGIDVGKAIDRAAGAERDVVGIESDHRDRPWTSAWRTSAQLVSGRPLPGGNRSGHLKEVTAPATPEAARWQGWGTALKPAWEPVVMARKPFPGTVAANVLAHGTGAINVDGCRIGTDGGTRREGKATTPTASGWANMRGHKVAPLDAGRWPANVCHDGSEEVVGMFPSTHGQGNVSRFFYCGKAHRNERDAGLPEGQRNTHPTVKPLALMRWLCRLVTPPGGLVLDPFCGSGTTLCAAVLEGFGYLGCDQDEQSVAIARARVAHHHGPLFAGQEGG